MYINDFATRTIDAGGKLTVKSALNPMLWFCAVVCFPSILVLAFLVNNPHTSQWILVGIFILVALPIVSTIFCAIFLLFFDRDKLQSEDYQIRKKSLELIQNKGESPQYQEESVGAIPKPLLIGSRRLKKRKREALV